MANIALACGTILTDSTPAGLRMVAGRAEDEGFLRRFNGRGGEQEIRWRGPRLRSDLIPSESKIGYRDSPIIYFLRIPNLLAN